MEAVYNRIKNETEKPQFIAVDAETHSAFNSIAPTVSGLSYANHLGFHNYGTNDFAGVEARYNGKRGWMTEWGKDASATDPIGIKENWLLLATNIHETLVGTDASAYLAWRMVHGNNTGQVWAMIGVENGQYQIQNSFYAVKHYAKHISSGHQRFPVTDYESQPRVPHHRSYGFALGISRAMPVRLRGEWATIAAAALSTEVPLGHGTSPRKEPTEACS